MLDVVLYLYMLLSQEKGTSRGDSVFGADYSTLERMDQSNSQYDVHIRSVDASTSELDFTDDFDDSMKKVKIWNVERVIPLFPPLHLTITVLLISLFACFQDDQHEEILELEMKVNFVLLALNLKWLDSTIFHGKSFTDCVLYWIVMMKIR